MSKSNSKIIVVFSNEKCADSLVKELSARWWQGYWSSIAKENKTVVKIDYITFAKQRQ